MTARARVPGVAWQRPFVYWDDADHVWRIEWHAAMFYAEASTWRRAFDQAFTEHRETYRAARS